MYNSSVTPVIRRIADIITVWCFGNRPILAPFDWRIPPGPTKFGARLSRTGRWRVKQVKIREKWTSRWDSGGRRKTKIPGIRSRISRTGRKTLATHRRPPSSTGQWILNRSKFLIKFDLVIIILVIRSFRTRSNMIFQFSPCPSGRHWVVAIWRWPKFCFCWSEQAWRAISLILKYIIIFVYLMFNNKRGLTFARRSHGDIFPIPFPNFNKTHWVIRTFL